MTEQQWFEIYAADIQIYTSARLLRKWARDYAKEIKDRLGDAKRTELRRLYETKLKELEAT